MVNGGKYTGLSDHDLLQRHADTGDNEWLGILLQRYTLLLYGTCMKYLKNEDMAKDAVQQIFLKVLQDVKKYDVAYFKSWLYMVAKNYCLTELRNSKTHPVMAWDEHEDSADTTLTDVGNLPDSGDWLQQALEELPPLQSLCIKKFYLDKKTYQQVAEEAALTLLQVKSYIQNGKRNLKISIEKKIKNQQQHG